MTLPCSKSCVHTHSNECKWVKFTKHYGDTAKGLQVGYVDLSHLLAISWIGPRKQNLQWDYLHSNWCVWLNISTKWNGCEYTILVLKLPFIPDYTLLYHENWWDNTIFVYTVHVMPGWNGPTTIVIICGLFQYVGSRVANAIPDFVISWRFIYDCLLIKRYRALHISYLTVSNIISSSAFTRLFIFAYLE